MHDGDSLVMLSKLPSSYQFNSDKSVSLKLAATFVLWEDLDLLYYLCQLYSMQLLTC